jgi:hypothetical protein
LTSGLGFLLRFSAGLGLAVGSVALLGRGAGGVLGVGASGEQASDHDCENFAHWIDSSIENWLETPPGEQKVSH